MFVVYAFFFESSKLQCLQASGCREQSLQLLGLWLIHVGVQDALRGPPYDTLPSHQEAFMNASETPLSPKPDQSLVKHHKSVSEQAFCAKSMKPLSPKDAPQTLSPTPATGLYPVLPVF